MTKQYPHYEVPRRSIKDRLLSQRPSALIIEGLLVLVAVVATVGFLNPAPANEASDALIAELKAIIAVQEAALVEAAEALSQPSPQAAIPKSFLDANAARNMAWTSLTQEEYRSAIALFNRLIEQGDADIDTIFARGYAYSMIDEHAAAAQDYATVLQQQPDNQSALNNICWALSETGEHEAALAACNRLHSLVPDADYVYLNRGIALEKMGEMQAAMNDYVEWIKRSKQRIVRNENLVWESPIEVKMAQGHVFVFPFQASSGQEVSITATSSQRGLDADPLLLVLDPQGQALTANDDSGEWWDSAVRFPVPASGEYTAVLTHAGGSTEGTVEVALEFSGLFTQGTDGARFKSDAYRALMSGDYALAQQYFRRALDHNQHDAEAMNWLGVTYRYLGEYDAAIMHIGMSMRLDDGYTLPYLSRGITYEMMGESKASAADYYRYAMRNRSRSLFHAELTGNSNFELPMREGWVYSIPFDAKRGQVLDLSVKTVAPGFVDPLIVLIGPNGQALTGDDDISMSEYDAVISDYTLPKSGEYTIVLSHAEGGAKGMVQVHVDLGQAAPMSAASYTGCNGGH